MGNKVQAAVGRVAAASRKTHRGKKVNQNPDMLDSARQDLLEARLERAIDQALRPGKPYRPLDDDRRTRLAEMLTP